MITCQEKLQKLRDNEKQLRVEDHEIRKVKVSCATNTYVVCFLYIHCVHGLSKNMNI